jgi:hypothetical protein
MLQKCRDRRVQALADLDRTRSNLFLDQGANRIGRRHSGAVFIRTRSIG